MIDACKCTDAGRSGYHDDVKNGEKKQNSKYDNSSGRSFTSTLVTLAIFANCE